jgi:hypothetical protein
MVYVGVDLHRKSSHVIVLADDGELLASRRIASQPDVSTDGDAPPQRPKIAPKPAN